MCLCFSHNPIRSKSFADQHKISTSFWESPLTLAGTKGSQQLKSTSDPKSTPLQNILRHSILYSPLFLIHVHCGSTILLPSPTNYQPRPTPKSMLFSNDYRNKYIHNSERDSHSKIHWISVMLSHLPWQQVLRSSSERYTQVPEISMRNRFSEKPGQHRHKLSLYRKIWFSSLPKKMRCTIKWAKNKPCRCFPSAACSRSVPCELHVSRTGKLPVSSFRPFFPKKRRHHHLVQSLLLANSLLIDCHTLSFS